MKYESIIKRDLQKQHTTANKCVILKYMNEFINK